MLRFKVLGMGVSVRWFLYLVLSVSWFWRSFIVGFVEMFFFLVF